VTDTVYLCRKCSPTTVPDGLTAELRHRVGEIVRLTGSRVEAIKVLHDEAGLQLKQAKGIAQHLGHEAGRCGRCSREVAPGEAVHCATCGCLTFHW
jgi:hypothetical protein